MKLYSMTLSPNGRKAESLVAYLGLDIEIQQVNLLTGEQKDEAFLAVNPNGKVPVIVDGDFVLWESNAVLLYLASQRPDCKLVPEDTRTRCDMERWMCWQLGHFAPPMAKLLTENFVKSKALRVADPDPEVVATATKDMDRLYAMLDAHLAGKQYMCGDALTLADFAMGPWTDFAELLEYDDSRFTNVKAWLGRVTALPGWVLTPPPPPA